MNIETLKYFIKIVEYRNLSLVSKIFHISQSALSQQLASLESKLNVKLLNRNSQGVTLTPEGEILFKYAKSIIDSYNKIFDDINNLKSENKVLSIDATESLSSILLPKILTKFKSTFDYNHITLNTVTSFSLLNLSNHISDIYIGYLESENLNNIKSYLIGHEELILVSHKSFPKDYINKYDLINTPLITKSDKPILTYSIDAEQRIDNTKKLNIVCTTNSFVSALNATKPFNATTFIPKSFLKLYCSSEFKRITISDFKISLPLYIVCTEEFNKNNQPVIRFLKNNLTSFFI